MDQPEKPKWSKGKVALFIAVMVFPFVVVPFLIIQPLRGRF